MTDQDTQKVEESQKRIVSSRAVLPRSARKKGISPWIVNIIVLIVGLVIGYVSHPFIAPPSPATPDKAQTSMDDLIAQVRHFRGNPNATITLLEFSDYQ
jgi:hypothetical protein